MPYLWRRTLIGALAVYVIAASVFLLAGGGSASNQQRAAGNTVGREITDGLYSLEFTTIEVPLFFL